MSWSRQGGGARGYHHGNLKEALIRAAPELIAKKGPDGCTFAEAARWAGRRRTLGRPPPPAASALLRHVDHLAPAFIGRSWAPCSRNSAAVLPRISSTSGATEPTAMANQAPKMIAACITMMRP